MAFAVCLDRAHAHGGCRLVGTDPLRHQEQHDPFTDEAPAEARLRIFGFSTQNGGRM